MQTEKETPVSIPYPSQWDIDASIAGRSIISGKLIYQSVTNNQVMGALNLRGTFIPIQGYWSENSKQIRFDSPYASFVGNLSMFDEPQIKMRHYLLRGTFIMKPPSIQAGEYGTWIATTDISMS